MRLYVAGAHAARVEREGLLIEVREAPLVLGDHLPIPRDRQRELARVSEQLVEQSFGLEYRLRITSRQQFVQKFVLDIFVSKVSVQLTNTKIFPSSFPDPRS